MMMRRRRRPFLRADRGAVAVEFAILAPVLLVMMGGVYELGHLLQAQTAANLLASQYAISWADCSDNPAGTCNTELGQYKPVAAIGNISPQLIAANVVVQMYQVKMSGTTPAVIYPTGSTLSAAQTTAAQASLSSGDSGVVVTVSYDYPVVMFPGFLQGTIPNIVSMSYTVVQLKA